MTDRNIEDGLALARGKVHKLAGLLSGMSAALYLARLSDNTDNTLQMGAEMESLLVEAGQELGELRSILHEMQA